MNADLAAIVPMRGGSKSIPGKNIKMFCGKPLCEWTLRAALDCPRIGPVVVSTDSDQIAAVARGVSNDIAIRERPAELSGDLSSTESALVDAITHQALSAEFVVTLQVTSPQTVASDLSNAIALREARDADAVVTASRVGRFFWSDDGAPLNYDPERRPMRQQWSGTLMENGAFYLSRRESLLAGHSRLHGRVAVYEMEPWAGTELDEVHDWVLLERAFAEMGRT